MDDWWLYSLNVSYTYYVSFNILGLRWRIVLTRFWLASTSQIASTSGLLFWMESGTTLRVPIRPFLWEYSHTSTIPFTGKTICYYRSENLDSLVYLRLSFDCEKSRSKCCKTHISEQLCTLIKTVKMFLKSI